MISIPITYKKWHTPIFGNISKYIKILTSQIISIVLEHEKIKNKNFVIEIKFCSVDEMKKYNEEFNQKNYACDTFSLLYNSHQDNAQATKPTVLGVIFFCSNVMKQDLEVFNNQFSQNKDYLHHYVHLLIHSTLHVLGYDHQTPLQQQSMEAKEILLLSKLNIQNPYQYLK